ncbi:MAG: cysteine hydrolase [Pseudobacteriovorax sp.]|nr:cysteine hydrolase [Pseudobacteriovorax sp.]
MKHPTLILIDVQKGFQDPRWGSRNNPDAEINIRRLLDIWREKKLQIIHIQHCSTEETSTLRAGTPGHEFQEETAPIGDEQVIQKIVNSAFIGTNLDDYLKQSNTEELVIVGLTTDHCVSTTTRMAGNLGYKTYLVSDGCATFNRIDRFGREILAEDIHQIHLASLDGEFCTVMTTNNVLKALN